MLQHSKSFPSEGWSERGDEPKGGGVQLFAMKENKTRKMNVAGNYQIYIFFRI